MVKVAVADVMDGKRTRGRPKISWIGCVEKDARVLNIPNWQKVSRDRAVFRRGNGSTCTTAKKGRNSRMSKYSFWSHYNSESKLVEILYKTELKVRILVLHTCLVLKS
ncbi:hypothetical protein ACKWTF_000721 [Chironomus riparius]